jgi:hypothetical protein
MNAKQWNKIFGVMAAGSLLLGATGCGKSLKSGFSINSSTSTGSQELPGSGGGGGGTGGNGTGNPTANPTPSPTPSATPTNPVDPIAQGNIECKVYELSSMFRKMGCLTVRENSPNLNDNLNSGSPNWTAEIGCLKLPDFATMEPIAKFRISKFDVSDRDWAQGFPNLPAGANHLREYYGLSCTARIDIAEGGWQSFALAADDGAALFIDGRKVIDNDGNHPVTVKEGRIELGRGSYKMRVEWYQGPRDRIALELRRYTGSSGYAEIIPANEFLVDGSDAGSCMLPPPVVTSLR